MLRILFISHSSTFSWALDSDKAAFLHPMHLVFIDLTSRQRMSGDCPDFGDVGVPFLLFFNDAVPETSTNVVSDVH